ncbi:MAG: hypothetical protein RLZZ214_289, partial [Verrucomicrobiota bacterium]
WNGGTITTLDAATDLRLAGRLSNGSLKLNLTPGSSHTLDIGSGRNAVIEASVEITGNGDLTKTGGGRAVINGPNPAFSGGFAMNGGSLEIVGDDSALGAVPEVLVPAAISLNGGTLALNQGFQGTITMTAAGSGYSSFPRLDLSGVSGETVLTHGRLAAISVTQQGASNHTAAAITFSSPDLAGGVQAAATATVSGGKVTAVALTNPGAGYTVVPKVFISLTGGTSTTTAPAAAVSQVVLEGAVRVNPGYDYDGSPIVVTGAGFAATGGATTATTAISLHAHRGVFLGESGGTITCVGDHSIAGPVSGPGGLTKRGDGVLELGGNNIYQGDTTVTEGVLKLGLPDSLADGAAIRIAASGAALELAFTGIEMVDQLWIGGVQQAAGIWAATGTPGADHTSDLILGGGMLQVTHGGLSVNFAAWATSLGMTGGVNGDSDNDGIPNLVEYALALNPSASDGSPGILVGRTLIFNKRAEAVINGDVTYRIEKSADLGVSDPWTVVTPTTDTALEISYTFPAGTAGFARLSATAIP